MALKLANNVSSTLDGSVAAIDTSIAVAAEEASMFPELGPDDWFPVTVVDGAGNVEIMRVTARSSATMTVVRGREGTTPLDFDGGARVEIRMTAGTFEEAIPDFLTPANVSPAHGATDVSDITFTGTVYGSFAGVAQASRRVRVYEHGTNTVAWDSGDVAGAGTQVHLPSWRDHLDLGTEYDWTMQYTDVDSLASPPSRRTSFTTATIYVAAPSVTSPANNATGVGETPTLASSAFSVVGDTDTHASSDWEIRSTADDSLVWSSTADTVNLTSISVPANTLDEATEYELRVRHTGATYGASGWSAPITFTTADTFTLPVVGVALVTAGGGGGTWAHVDADGNNFAVNGTFFNAHPVWGAIEEQTIDSQIMVRIPKFYYKVGAAPGGSDHAGKKCWWISSAPAAGFTLHTAFMKDGSEVDQIWVGKYQARNSGTLLLSQTGGAPTVSQNIGTFSTWAANRGSGWMLWSIYHLAAIQMLYLIEYADGDSQAAIGQGRVSAGDAANVDASDVAQATYRGIVGLWGNVMQWVDGLDFASGVIRVWDRLGNRTWVSTGISTKPANGFGINLKENAGAGYDLRDIFFVDTTTTTEASSTFADYQYVGYSGNQVAAAGGSWSNAAGAGLFFLSCSDVASYAHTSIGGRLARVT